MDPIHRQKSHIDGRQQACDFSKKKSPSRVIMKQEDGLTIYNHKPVLCALLWLVLQKSAGRAYRAKVREKWNGLLFYDFIISLRFR